MTRWTQHRWPSDTTYRVRRLPHAKIKIDGRLDEPEWSRANVERHFIFPWKKAEAPATEFMAFCDDEYLYFAFRVEDADIVVLDKLRDKLGHRFRGSGGDVFQPRPADGGLLQPGNRLARPGVRLPRFILPPVGSDLELQGDGDGGHPDRQGLRGRGADSAGARWSRWDFRGLRRA